jgi:16S rRNA (cytosine1407-C5)-methyltransferase
MGTKKAQIPKLQVFLDSIKEIYGHTYPQVEKGLKQTHLSSFRINLSKIKPEEVLESLKNQGFRVIKGPLTNSYISTHLKGHISDTVEFIEGKIYMQELSSMIPPLVLDPQEADKIMDMASAPGSKTTQMADLTHDKAEIVALEKHPIRIKTLEHNVELQGYKNIRVVLGNGIKFDRRNPQYTEYFDRVLADVPCSTEGGINITNPRTYKHWNIHKRKDMSRVQKGILMSGIRMLKPGGTLIYSTCTYGMEENELVLDWLLQKMPELKIEKVDLKLQNTVNGIAKWEGKPLNPKVKNALRVLPNDMFTGFFVAKIIKPKIK